MIVFDDVSFSYGAKIEGGTIKNVSFSLPNGDFAAFCGTNGAGKSTTVKLIAGLLKPTSGCVTLDGMDTRKLKVSKIARKIGFLFQNPDRQICKNTVAEEIMFSLTLTSDDSESNKRRLAELISEFEFDPDAEPFSLSRGERQKLALASVIAPKPDILILDEPTTGLDYRECTHMMELISSFNRLGVTVVMVCHDMEVVLDYASHVITMHDGEITSDGATREIFADSAKLREASLASPQIAGLSGLLGESFDGIFTADEMIGRIKTLKGGAIH